MLFTDCIGQETIKTKLVESARLGRIPHAQLFSGPEGSGTLPLAIAYAQYLACVGSKTNDACGTCSSCQKFNKLAHPDLHFSFPVNTSKKISKDPISDDYLSEWREFVLDNPYFRANSWYQYIGLENKQGLISKKEGDAIMRKLSLKSFESDYKFMIIWLPEKMHNTAANHLLKLVEEPPEKTIFLMVAEEPNQVMLTISSRTQPVQLKRIEKEAMVEVLINRHGLPPAEANSIERLSKGSYITAQELIQTTEETAFNHTMFTQVMRLCWQRKYVELDVWTNEMADIGRERLKSFFEYALRFSRENFISNLHRPELVYMNAEESSFSEKFHPFINGRNIVALYKEFGEAAADIERNGYAKLVLFTMCLKIVKLIRK